MVPTGRLQRTKRKLFELRQPGSQVGTSLSTHPGAPRQRAQSFGKARAPFSRPSHCRRASALLKAATSGLGDAATSDNGRALPSTHNIEPSSRARAPQVASQCGANCLVLMEQPLGGQTLGLEMAADDAAHGARITTRKIFSLASILRERVPHAASGTAHLSSAQALSLLAPPLIAPTLPPPTPRSPPSPPSPPPMPCPPPPPSLSPPPMPCPPPPSLAAAAAVLTAQVHTSYA